MNRFAENTSSANLICIVIEIFQQSIAGIAPSTLKNNDRLASLSCVHEIIIGDLFRLILDIRRESISARVSKVKSNKSGFIFVHR